MRKRHGYAERLRYMRMLEEGYSVWHIHCRYGIDRSLLETLWIQYKREGVRALAKRKKASPGIAEKIAAIRDIEEKGLPLVEVLLKHGVSESALLRWRRKYRAMGVEGLVPGKRGRPPKAMGRPKKKTVEEMTELERLQKENQELRTQVALLKKVRALVEERNARLYGIGHRPSKD